MRPRDKIERLLADNGGSPLDVGSIAAALGMGTVMVRRELHALASRGRARRVGNSSNWTTASRGGEAADG